METFTLKEYMNSWVMYSWDDKVIHIMRSDSTKRKPYLTYFGVDDVPKDLLNRHVIKVTHAECNVFYFWLEEE